MVLELFVHDYDIGSGSYDPTIPGNEKILSFCADRPMMVMTGQDIWSHNKQAIASYVPNGKDLKLIWEKSGRVESIIKTLKPARELGTEEFISFSFVGRTWNFYVLNISSENIPAFQERVRNLPDFLEPPPPLPISGE